MASKILFCPKQPPAIMELVKALTPPGFDLVAADLDTPEFYEAAAQAEYYLGFARRMGNEFFRAAPKMKPARARCVAMTPACAFQPGCKRLVHEPSARYSMIPDA